eukprot:g6331.t1
MNKLSFWISIIVALLGPFQFGLGLAIMNTMLDAVSDDMEFDKNIGGAVVTAVIYSGCAIGSLMSSFFEFAFRRFSQLVVALLFLTGSLLCAFTSSHQFCWNGVFHGCVPIMLFLGRAIIGFASGITVVISPKFLAEVSVPNLRMLLCTAVEICIVIGILFGFVIGLPYEFSSSNSSGYSWWRLMFLTGSLPAVIQTLLHIYTLHCPYNRPLDAVQVEVASSEVPSVESRVPLKALSHKKYRKCIVLGMGVPVVCQLSGINVLGAYSTVVFKNAGFSRPIIGSILFGFVNLVCTAITAFVIEHYQRRKIAFFSFLGMGVCFTGVALADLTRRQMQGVLSVGFVLLYVAFFSAGCGPLTTGYAPEVVPPSLAGIVLGAGQCLCRLTDLILVLVFPELLSTLGALPAFLMFSAFAFLSYFFLKTFMVETKGRELKEIYAELIAE